MEKIQVLKSRGHKQIEIAQEIGVSPTTMSRELKRNKGLRGYRYQQAHRLATVRKSNSYVKPHKMTADKVVWIESVLVNEQWSPERISGILVSK